MKKVFSNTRREFLKLSAMAAVGSATLTGAASAWSKPGSDGGSALEVYIFSKHLQFLDYRAMSEAAREMGFDGIDLTVRPKGHVLPERVTEDLPRATEAMQSFGLKQGMFTTKVLNAGNNLDRRVLETASGLGYGCYRTGWYRYGKDQEVQEYAPLYRKQLQDLARLNGSLGISGSYHNHSGNYYGASIWELDHALEGLSPAQMGCQYDIMHATVEGGKNWPIGLRLIRDHINSLVVKDFKWARVDGVWKPVFLPLGEGMVDFVSYFGLLKKYRINVPVSIHCEYDLGGAEHGGKPSIDHKQVFSRLKNDLLFLRNAWEQAS